MGFVSRVGQRMAPRVTDVAPGLTSTFVREALHRAIAGVGPLSPAADAARKALREAEGHSGTAITEIIETHVRLAGAQGFLTNLGGLTTMAVTVPANITGLALIQTRMVAMIAHLRGYDIDDPRVRNAVLVTLIGEDDVTKLVKKRSLPAPPMALATAPTHDHHLDERISGEVASELVERVIGKRLASTAGRRVPVMGGLVGGGADGYATWRIGRYADREFLPRARRYTRNAR